MKKSKKIIWLCIALIALAVIATVALAFVMLKDEKVTENALLWASIVLAIFSLMQTVALVCFFAKTKKQKTLAVCPLLLASVTTGKVSAIIVLSILSVVLTLFSVALAVVKYVEAVKFKPVPVTAVESDSVDKKEEVSPAVEEKPLSFHELSLKEIEAHHRDVISVEEAHEIISDEVAMEAIEDVSQGVKHIGKRGIVNIDTLSRNFSAGEVVTLDALKEKKLIDKKVQFVKVLARGTLDKPLTVELHGYSLDAVKMIVITGGKVERL